MIGWWLIDDWLIIDWWLIDDWLMIDLWLIDDWLMIDRLLIDDWLMIDCWLIADWLMIDWWLIDGDLIEAEKIEVVEEMKIVGYLVRFDLKIPHTGDTNSLDRCG